MKVGEGVFVGTLVRVDVLDGTEVVVGAVVRVGVSVPFSNILKSEQPDKNRIQIKRAEARIVFISNPSASDENGYDIE